MTVRVSDILIHTSCAACADDTANGAKRTTESIHAWILHPYENVLLLHRFGFLVSSLEKKGRASVELGGGRESGRVNLGHLEDGNTEADDDEAHNEGNDRRDRGFKALEEDLGVKEINNDARSVVRLERTIVVSIEKNVTLMLST